MSTFTTSRKHNRKNMLQVKMVCDIESKGMFEDFFRNELTEEEEARFDEKGLTVVEMFQSFPQETQEAFLRRYFAENSDVLHIEYGD